jgi:hypothetical protein
MKILFTTAMAASAARRWRRFVSVLVTPLLLLPVLLMLHAEPVRALAEPTLDQVYQTAQAGHIDQARQMMERVLRDHPNSAKAHYVEAELLTRQGLSARAREELAAAERLAPGLPFAQVSSVQSLRRELAITTSSDTPPRFSATGSSGATMQWGIVLAILGGALVAWLLMRLGRPQAAPMSAAAASSGFQMAPPGTASTAAPSSGGLGRQVVGGLATGLAVGAGVMAAEAIGHRLFSDHSPTVGSASTDTDLGGRDFGINAPDSWDDSSPLSGDTSRDWDS